MKKLTYTLLILMGLSGSATILAATAIKAEDCPKITTAKTWDAINYVTDNNHLQKDISGFYSSVAPHHVITAEGHDFLMEFATTSNNIDLAKDLQNADRASIHLPYVDEHFQTCVYAADMRSFPVYAIQLS